MDHTGRYSLPLILPQQAQKHITHNEALALIDSLFFPVISGFGSNVPPANPIAGAAWFTESTPAGDWTDEPLKLATFTDSGWRFAAALKGMCALDAATEKMVIFDGAGWVSLGAALDLNNIDKIGINASADATNKLAVRSNAALLTATAVADGGDGNMQLKINKESAAKTSSLLFQTNWSGRAEMGLSGDDDFRIKVSADGTTWNNAVSISRATGLVTLTSRSVANAALANVASGSIKGRASANIGIVEDLTGTQVAGLLPLFSSGTKGLVPASGGNGDLALRGDGSWADPLQGPDRFYAFNDCLSSANSQDWTYSVAGTGATHSIATFGTSNSIGASLGSLGTTATGRCAISAGGLFYYQLGQGAAKFKTRVKLPVLSDATNSYILRCGFIDTITGESTDGVFFRYSHALSNGNFQAVCRANNIETVLDTAILASTSATFVLEVVVNTDASLAEFRINGATVAAITTNIPSGPGRDLAYGLMALRSSGTAAITPYLVDYLLADLHFAASRE